MRNIFQSIDDLPLAESWLTAYRSTYRIQDDLRVLFSTKLQDLIYREFVHQDKEFQNLLEQARATGFHMTELANDVFIAFYSTVIRQKENLAFQSQTIAKPLIDAILQADKFPELKALCEDKELPAYEGSVAFIRTIADNLSHCLPAPQYSQYIEIIKLLESQIILIFSQYSDLQYRERSQGVDLSAQKLKLIKRLYEKNNQIQNLQKKVNEWSFAYAAALKAVVQNALDTAIIQAGQVNSILNSWGSGGDGMKNTPQNRELLSHVRNSSILSDMLHFQGRYLEILSQKRKNSFQFGRGEKYDIIQGNDLTSCLASELALLGTPETEILFMQRYQQKRLQQYRKRQAITKGKGDMILLIDESSSTKSLQGWAKAFAMAMLDVAAHGNRKFALIHFSSSHQIKTDRFEPGKYTTDDVMNAMEHNFEGGTNFDTPLREALKLLEHDYENADILMITDGECEIGEEFKNELREQLSKNKAILTGILLDKGGPCGESLEPICDYIYHSKELTEDEIAVSILEKSA